MRLVTRRLNGDTLTSILRLANKPQTMGAGKNKSHRKKRISKHVLDAQERKKKEEIEKKLLDLEGGNSSIGDDGADKNGKAAADADVNESSRLASSKSSKKTKDPEEAASYLANWDMDRKNGTKTFKFNKNTSSWLQRHSYDFDKVSKNTFALLVEYLCQGAEGARLRVEEDAKRRARRYKDWEKSQDSKSETDERKMKDESASDEGRVWSELSDHDKRKEYKRARKLIDALKATRETSAEA